MDCPCILGGNGCTFALPSAGNRLIWLGVGALIFAFAYWRFSFSERSTKPGKKSKAEDALKPALVAIPPAARQFGPGAQWAQFWGSTKLEFRRLIKTIPFVVVTAAALLNCLTTLIFNSTEAFGNTSFPVTYQMLELIAGTLYIFLIALITYHAGVLIWEERDSSNDEVHDALPVPEWPAFAAKFVACPMPGLFFNRLSAAGLPQSTLFCQNL